MKPYKRKYLDFYQLSEHEWIQSEISEREAVDLHHIKISGKRIHEPWAVIALSREEHNMLGERGHDDYLKAAKFRHMTKFLIDRLLGGDKDVALDIIGEY